MGDVFFGSCITSPEKRKRDQIDQDVDENDVTLQISPGSVDAYARSQARRRRSSAPSSPLANQELLVNLATPSPSKHPTLAHQQELKLDQDLLHLFSVRKATPRKASPLAHRLESTTTTPTRLTSTGRPSSPAVPSSLHASAEIASLDQKTVPLNDNRPLSDAGYLPGSPKVCRPKLLIARQSPSRPVSKGTAHDEESPVNAIALEEDPTERHPSISTVSTSNKSSNEPEAPAPLQDQSISKTPCSINSTSKPSQPETSSIAPQGLAPSPAKATNVSTRKRKLPMASSRLPRGPSTIKTAENPTFSIPVLETSHLSSSINSHIGPSSMSMPLPSSSTVNSTDSRTRRPVPKARIQKPRAPAPADPSSSEQSRTEADTDDLNSSTRQIRHDEGVLIAESLSHDTDEEAPKRPKKVSLNSVQQMAQRLFAPGHFDDPAVVPQKQLLPAKTPVIGSKNSRRLEDDKLQEAALPIRRTARTRTQPFHAKPPQMADAGKRAAAHPPTFPIISAKIDNVVNQNRTLNVAPRAKVVLEQQQQQQQTSAGLSTPQLTLLTKQNTNRNKECYNLHQVVMVHKDEPRPPSPSAKIRKNIPGGTKQGREDRAQKRRALKDDDSGPSASGSQLRIASSGHPLGAGDEEGGYRTPKRSNGKCVKWSRALINEDLAEIAHHEPSIDARAERSILSQTPALDQNGNAQNAKQPLSPLVPRQQVVISKLIYLDDL